MSLPGGLSQLAQGFNLFAQLLDLMGQILYHVYQVGHRSDNGIGRGAEGGGEKWLQLTYNPNDYSGYDTTQPTAHGRKYCDVDHGEYVEFFYDECWRD